MRGRPRDVNDRDVLDLVRQHWDEGATAVTYLPVGFGAYHWRAEATGDPRLFVSLDMPLPRHDPSESRGGLRQRRRDLPEARLRLAVSPIRHGRDLHRGLLSPRLARVREWSEEHAGHLERLDPDSFVVTHGEPGEHNQWVAQDQTYLLDWESLLLAPAERDLGTLVQSGVSCERADPDRVLFFDLEWRLAEIHAYTP